MKSLVLTLTLLFCSNVVMASGLSSRLDNLGGNKDLMKKASALDPNNQMRIVQARAVDRSWRLELGINYGLQAGGDSYFNTSSLGAFADLHITPRWSIGVRHDDYANTLNSEGKRIFGAAQSAAAIDGRYAHPDIDHPLSSTLGIISFYPIYGKINLFDRGVAQFDFYVLGGAGQTKLSSGSSPSWTAGGGVGIWLAKHLSSRLELRYQNYQDEISTGSRDQNTLMTTFSIGILL